MSKERHKIIPAVYLILVNDNSEILLLQRQNSGFMDGWYSLPAGHLDGNESFAAGMVREAKEEAGIEIDQSDLKMVVTLNRIDTARESVDIFFTTDKYTGEIENKEPNRCSELKFFPINDLPEKTIPYVAQAIECYQKGIHYSELGFDDKNNVGFAKAA